MIHFLFVTVLHLDGLRVHAMFTVTPPSGLLTDILGNKGHLGRKVQAPCPAGFYIAINHVSQFDSV